MTDLDTTAIRTQMEALDGHTPAPWACHFGDATITCDCKNVLGDYGGMGAIACINAAERMEMPWGDDNGPADPEARANARLIAVAPDLHAATSALCDEVDRLRAENKRLLSILKENNIAYS